MNTGEEKCGAKKKDGTGYCKYGRARCPHHNNEERAVAERERLAGAASKGTGPPGPEPDEARTAATLALPGYGPELRDTALEERSARRLAWWVASEMARGALETQRGTVLSNVLRLLHSMGPEPMDEEDALAEVEMRGRLMHGQPPRDPEEWARAERTFEPEAIGEFRRWERLILARRAGIPIQPMIEAAGDAWAEATDKWREPATPP
jgi:hypothetical protein